MTSINLDNYKNSALKTSCGIFILLLFLSVITKNKIIIGLLIGSSLANINIFVLALSVYNIIIRKKTIMGFTGPVLFFLIMSSAGLFLVFFYPGLILGFAFGLSSPLILGAVLTSLPNNVMSSQEY